MKRILTNPKRSLQYLCLQSEIPKHSSRVFSTSENDDIKQDVAILNTGGNFYAICNICAHQGRPLGEGILEGNVFTCPWHGWKYGVRNGRSPHSGGDSLMITKYV
ncbi:MAG: Rieske (2Fe-2S) protein [Nitrososphaeraceae archaeon]|nr:Rieske (2Fe-2S) protein [Nitrososphaeraceae archaeon]